MTPLELSPAHAAARAALEAGRIDDATSAVEALLARSPDDGAAWLLRGVLALQQADPKTARNAFDAAARYGADTRRTRLGSGMAALGLGETEQAWELFDAVVTEHADDAEAMHWLLRAGSALERWDALATRLAGFVDRQPEQHAVRFALGAVYLRLGQADAARREYETLRAAAPAFDGLDDLGRALEA